MKKTPISNGSKIAIESLYRDYLSMKFLFIPGFHLKKTTVCLSKIIFYNLIVRPRQEMEYNQSSF